MVKSKLTNLLTKEEQKLLQKYDILETLFDYWENLEKVNSENTLEKANSQSLDKNSHKNNQKVATWQEVLSQIFDKNKLQKNFEQQILNKNSENSENQKSPNENCSSQNLENFNQAGNLKKQDKKFTKNDLLAKISKSENNLFDNNYWTEFVLPQIEHPQFTRPKVWTISLEKKHGNKKNTENWQTQTKSTNPKIYQKLILQNQNEIEKQSENENSHQNSSKNTPKSSKLSNLDYFINLDQTLQKFPQENRQNQRNWQKINWQKIKQKLGNQSISNLDSQQNWESAYPQQNSQILENYSTKVQNQKNKNKSLPSQKLFRVPKKMEKPNENQISLKADNLKQGNWQNDQKKATDQEIQNSPNSNFCKITQNFSVPEILLGGNHLQIAKWRQGDWQNDQL